LKKDKLYYYRSKPISESDKPAGSIHLKKCMISKSAAMFGRDHCFELIETIKGEADNRTFFISADTKEYLDEWISALREAGPSLPDTFEPDGFHHKVHVTYDAAHGKFNGLPPEWEALLKSSGISQEEQKSNPKEVIRVLDFQSRLESALYKEVPMPKSEIPPSLEELVSNEDPFNRYSDLIKIGEGAFGDVWQALDKKNW